METNPKGRVETRIHGRIAQTVRKGMAEGVKRGELIEEGEGQFIGGKCELSQDQAEYIGEILSKRVDAGINGPLSEGFMELLSCGLPMPGENEKETK